ncbi:uncharacterized protein LOC107613191 isoform X1 [Arachis ipaensis]|uniref:uncharacterized protein LOC107613191 isoform X1 n=2 Tax=Arachis ipaensis TaxID=130454 RepID=UPI000A2AFAC6|nr:uncharacterized protein LOC107613191 isoform X1 [Arachis ipaensis]XP_025672982.1 uncharacterized protein LOC112772292 isoform X1 [Arachis hypogaea]
MKTRPKAKPLYKTIWGKKNNSNRGCLGHFTKMPAILLVDEASVGLIPHDQAARKDSRSEDFWSSSTIDIEYALRSQRSASSIGISFDPQNSAALANDHPEFVNHGLILWNQMRRHWVGNLRQQRRKQVGEPRLREKEEKTKIQQQQQQKNDDKKKTCEEEGTRKRRRKRNAKKKAKKKKTLRA